MNKFNFILDEAIEQTLLITEKFTITFHDGSQMIKEVALNHENIILLFKDEPDGKLARPGTTTAKGEAIIVDIKNSKNDHFYYPGPVFKTSSMLVTINYVSGIIILVDEMNFE
jgi:hypothetical protein